MWYSALCNNDSLIILICIWGTLGSHISLICIKCVFQSDRHVCERVVKMVVVLDTISAVCALSIANSRFTN